ncbi:hypothetical protein R5R35_008813 [Gryllus longicercus]|uniref:C2H2-type domain-containing protein n=1 Tax=Gryllus longicercus TaxID=2509291 RepID=A0AAN9YVY1_9ORTH
MSTSAVVHTFKEKIEDAAAMVRSMDAEEKLQAVEYWNVVSEQLQIIVNHSAEDLGAFTSPLDVDKLPDFIDASQLVALGLAPTFMTSFVSNSGLDISSDILRKHSSKDVEGTVVITTALSETVSLPSLNSESAIVIDSVSAMPQTEIEACQTLPADRMLNISECEASHITSIVDNELVDPGVHLDDTVNSEALDIPDPIVEANDSLISQAINENSVESLTPVNGTSESVNSISHHPPKTKGKIKNGEGSEEQFYECSYCMRAFFTHSQLTTHMWTHTKPYVCSVCHARFATKGNLIVHNRRHSGELPHVCLLCQATFSTRGNLLRHRKAHSGEKPWQCTVCSSRFTEKKSLKVHMRRHTGERPYHCTMCPKSFTQAGILQTHVAAHLDQRAFPCSLCGKSFRQKSQLRLHEQRHAGLWKYECTLCPSKFLTKGDMQRHKRIHTGERPFTCKLCQKTFTRQQSLNEHMNRHYGLKPYRCKYCEKGYVEMSACYKHIKAHERSGNTLPVQKQHSDSSAENAEDEDIAGIFVDSSSIHRSDQNSFFIEELI